MKRYLFVGGKADGHMILVKEHYGHWEVPYISESIYDFSDESLGQYSVPFEKEVYRKIKWVSGNKTTLEFFALESMDNHTVMDTVLTNYRPKQDVEVDIRVNSMKNLLDECLSLMDQSLGHISVSSLREKIWNTTNKVGKFLFRMGNH